MVTQRTLTDYVSFATRSKIFVKIHPGGGLKPKDVDEINCDRFVQCLESLSHPRNGQ